MKEEDLNDLIGEEESEVEDDSPPWEEESENEGSEVEDNAKPVSEEDKIIDLRKNKFSIFMDLLRILKDTCTDLALEKGKIQQLSDKRQCIFSIDTKSIMGNTNLLMSSVATKHDLLEIFRKQHVDMYLEINDSNYIFRDSISKLEFIKPMEEYMENKFMPDSHLNKKVIKKDLLEKILEFDFDKVMLDRLMNSSKILKANVLTLIFEDGKANFIVKAGDSSSTTKISVVEVEDELEDPDIEGSLNFIIDVFMSFINGGIESLKFEVFNNKNKEEDFILKLTGDLTIEDEEITVPVIAWVPSEIKPLKRS